MTTRFSSDEAKTYWKSVHSRTRRSLPAVCFPAKPLLVNAFFDAIQASAVFRSLSQDGIVLEDARILEVGCGRGRWLARFDGHHADAVGVDVSEEAVNHCKDRALNAIAASATDLPFPDDSFDIVVSITVMIHLDPESQVEAATEMTRVCRPGGRIVLLEGTTPDESPHVFTRSLNEWKDLFPESEVRRVDGHYYAPILRWTWRSRLMNMRPWVARLAELIAVGYSLPLEWLLMRVLGGRARGDSLQHLIVLKKAER